MLDFVFNIEEILNDFFDYIYTGLVGFLSELFTMIDGLGVAVFKYDWIKGIIQFFSYFGWAMFTVGFIIAVFELTIEMQNGKGSFKDIFLNIIKGFMATSLFTVLPIELYSFAIFIQGSLSQDIIGLYETEGVGALGTAVLTSLVGILNPASGVVGVFLLIFFVVMIGYAMLKVFFANIKRGGILLILIAVGSLYMFSVPRGYVDGFVGWCKQVIALCLTAFLQTLILTVGLLTINENILIGLGLMLSATEVPRIAGHFGLDTTTKNNLGS
ncbi:MAG: conjugal transfer protein TrbL family protein, partial [Lachnospirales bacterium]